MTFGGGGSSLLLLLLLLLLAGSTGALPYNHILAENDTSTEAVENCDLPKGASDQQKCYYVQVNDDACEGGGYLNWTSYVVCEYDQASKIAIIVVSVIVLLYLFLMISSAADDFFSPNVTGIVENLGISEVVAGVTFMAFGNGAPDIFGAIASVLSSSRPKAGLAIGELLGAGIFVTLCVTATIVITKPFKVSKFATVRDLIFYIITLGCILFVFLYDTQVYLWEPLCFLGIYVIYVGTVIAGHYLHKKKRDIRRSARNSLKRSAAPSIHIIGDAVHALEAEEQTRPSFAKRLSLGYYLSSKRPSALGSFESSDSEEDDVIMSHHDIIHHGVEGTRSRAHSIAPPLPPTHIDSAGSFFHDILSHLNPIDSEEWAESGKIGKVFMTLKAPFMVVFKATIPLCEDSWSKPIAILLTITMPQCLLFCIQEWTLAPISGGPGLYAYALVASAIAAALVFFFTKQDDEPRYYKVCAIYLGFLMSIAWIYLIANEVVGAVTMLGVISQISHEVLGLTILAWCNSIGDMIADVAVVKQGYPRMALAAAIGGPLFNLLIGFGLPFGIAKAKGTYVQIAFSPVNHLLILFLGISLFTTLAAVFIQRFHVRRPHAFVLIGIYVAFIVMVILAEVNVFTWK